MWTVFFPYLWDAQRCCSYKRKLHSVLPVAGRDIVQHRSPLTEQSGHRAGRNLQRASQRLLRFSSVSSLNAHPLPERAPLPPNLSDGETRLHTSLARQETGHLDKVLPTGPRSRKGARHGSSDNSGHLAYFWPADRADGRNS